VIYLSDRSMDIDKVCNKNSPTPHLIEKGEWSTLKNDIAEIERVLTKPEKGISNEIFYHGTKHWRRCYKGTG